VLETLPKHEIKPPLMVVPIARKAEAYIRHIQPKVKRHDQKYIPINQNFPFISLSLSLSNFTIGGSSASTTLVTYLLLFSTALQVTLKPSGRS